MRRTRESAVSAATSTSKTTSSRSSSRMEHSTTSMNRSTTTGTSSAAVGGIGDSRVNSTTGTGSVIGGSRGIHTDVTSQKNLMRGAGSSSGDRTHQQQQQQQQRPAVSLAYDEYYIRGDATAALNAFTAAAAAEGETEAAATMTTSTTSTTIPSSDVSSNRDVSSSSSSDLEDSRLLRVATWRYNRYLLSELNDTTTINSTARPKKKASSVDDVLTQLKVLESNILLCRQRQQQTQNSSMTTEEKENKEESTTITEHYCTYNKALMYYSVSNYNACIQLCERSIRPPVQCNHNNHPQNTTKRSSSDAVVVVESVPVILFHITFVLLECILALGVGRNTGLNDILKSNLDQNATFTLTIEMIVEWLDDASMNTITEMGNNHDTMIMEQSQIKFLIPLYKSRIALSEFDCHTKLRMDSTSSSSSSTRSARKDMKTAMEIFHNKLRPSFSISKTIPANQNNSTATNTSANSNHTTFNETDSVTSSVNSTDDRVQAQPQQPAPETTTVSLDHPQSSSSSSSSPLMKFNQSALYVKAHLEQLKGNTKKSLILCTEAALGSTTTTGSNTNNYNSNTATTTATMNSNTSPPLNDTASILAPDEIPTSTTPNNTVVSPTTAIAWYDAIHANNIAVIYATNDRKHLAVHGMVKALRANCTVPKSVNNNNEDIVSTTNARTTATAPTTLQSEKLELSVLEYFLPDGTVKSDITTSLLYNTAICCLRTRHYTSAYECMVSCICHNDQYHPTFYNRTRCYVHLSEACIGWYSLQIKDLNNDSLRYKKHHLFATVEVDGAPKGIVLNNQSFRNDMLLVKEESLAVLGSRDDIEQMKRNPLLRARACLQYVLQTSDSQLETDAFMSARLSLCYVELAFGNYRKVRVMVTSILEEMQSIIARDENQSERIQRLHKRQFATASMYLCETSCALCDIDTILASILGDGKNDTLDQLASHLSGVTMEMMLKNDVAKRRFVKAQSTVRSSAAAAMAAVGKSENAKELAQSANTLAEDLYSSNPSVLITRRAMIYTSLRERNPSNAISILLS